MTNHTQPLPKPRRWLRFSLRTLLLAMTVLCVWLAFQVNAARRQRDAVTALRTCGGHVRYDNSTEIQIQADGKQAPRRKSWPAWLINVFGVDFFHSVVSVDFVGQQKNITDADIVGLRELSSLQQLDLRWSRITDAGMENLKTLSQLQGLSLGGPIGTTSDPTIPARSMVGDEGIKWLAGLIQLQHLAVGKTEISDAGLQHLRKMSRLKSLALNDTNISDAGLQYLEGLTELRYLELWNTKVTDDGVDRLARALPELTIVSPQNVRSRTSPRAGSP